MGYSGILSASFLIIKDTISSEQIHMNTNFVRIIYYGKHNNGHKNPDFSFYANAEVNEKNIMELAELYRTGWGIENGYPEKKDTGERTHSPDMHVRRLFFLFSVLLYNPWILLNMFRVSAMLNGNGLIESESWQ